MRESRGRRRGVLIAAAVATLGLLLTASLASSKTGDKLRSFKRPDPACGGPALAFDGKNLVFPCESGAPKIEIVSPRNGALVRSLTPTGTGGTVLGHVGPASWDATRKLMWDCISTSSPNSQTGAGVGTIDLTTGATSLKFLVRTCQTGLAYDPSDDTIWANGPGDSKVDHYRLDGTRIAQFDVKTPNALLGGQGAFGIAVLGDKLYVSTNGVNNQNGVVYRVRKDFTSSALAFHTGNILAEDTDCDENTFSGKRAFWFLESSGFISAYESSAANCASGASGSDEPPPPVAGKSVVADVVSGTVFIQLPPGKSIRRAKGKKSVVATTSRFRRYKGKANIPVGSTIDTRRGRIAITAAADLKGGTHSGDFYDGVFQIKQARSKSPVTNAELVNSTRGCSAKKASASAKKKRLGRLWATGKGRFRTKGRYSAAAVRGTTWLTEDRCDGTLTKVSRGRVAVRDFAKRKTIILSAGQSYFARAQRASTKG